MKKSTAIVLGLVVLVVGSIFLDRYREAHPFSTGGEFAQMLATMAVKDAKENNHVVLDYARID
jgi:hypothetical protein